MLRRYYLSFFIGFRYLRNQSLGNLRFFVPCIPIVGITIGVASLITVLSVMNGFEEKIKQSILGILPHAVIYKSNKRMDISETLPLLRADYWSMVAEPTPIIRGEVVIQSGSKVSIGYLLGIEPSQYVSLNSHIIAGATCDLVGSSYNVIVGHRLARQLGISVGDIVKLLAMEASLKTPFGKIPMQRYFTVSGLFDTGSDTDGQLIYIHFSDAQHLLRYKESQFSGWQLYLRNPFEVADYSNKPLLGNLYWSDWRAQRGELFQAVKMESNMMALMLGLIVLVAAFNIIAVSTAVVIEKRSEIAVLKTQGMTSNQILFIFIVQGAIVGSIGTVIGGFLGVITLLYLNQILTTLGADVLSFGGNLPVSVQYSQMTLLGILTISISMLATLYPAYCASIIRPAEVLRCE